MNFLHSRNSDPRTDALRPFVPQDAHTPMQQHSFPQYQTMSPLNASAYEEHMAYLQPQQYLQHHNEQSGAVDLSMILNGGRPNAQGRVAQPSQSASTYREPQMDDVDVRATKIRIMEPSYSSFDGRQQRYMEVRIKNAQLEQQAQEYREYIRKLEAEKRFAREAEWAEIHGLLRTLTSEVAQVGQRLNAHYVGTGAGESNGAAAKKSLGTGSKKTEKAREIVKHMFKMKGKQKAKLCEEDEDAEDFTAELEAMEEDKMAFA
uniref:BZIP domain-containing protein n=1 Tax=Mycena chlorophos TaxID=658473 RepID=A0ABQ0L7E4_MYCCL|nr:predicted protein [Mycena chlorophos]